MAPRGSEFEQEMSKLEAEIKRLEAEYNMFFAGRLPRLPWETRARVDTLVKHYDRMHIRNTAERFRFGTLQARYVAFCDLWERHLKAREEGRPTRGRKSAAPADSGTSPPAPHATKPERQRPSGPRVVAEAAIRDPAKESDRLKELYEQLSSARKAAGEQPLPYDRFAQVVRAQVTKLGRGSNEVAFKVNVQGGKVTLSAKVKDEK
jgi:hypothetical protein